MLLPDEESEQSCPLWILSEPRGILEYVSRGLCHSRLITVAVAKTKYISVNKELDSDVNQTHSREARKKNISVVCARTYKWR